MRRIVLALFLSLISSAAFAQCNGQFGANQYCGTGGSSGLPGPRNTSALPFTLSVGSASVTGGTPNGVLFNNSGVLGNTPSFTANLPVIGSATTGLTQGTRSGSTTTFATTSGALPLGNCAKFDGNGNIVDNGSVCGSGGGGNPGGSNTQLQYNNAGSFGGITGATTNGTAVTLISPTVTGSFTATGLVTNADLANSSTTVNGQTCTLGSSCTATATASSIVVGTTTIGSGTNPGFLFDNSGTLGNSSIAGQYNNLSTDFLGVGNNIADAIARWTGTRMPILVADRTVNWSTINDNGIVDMSVLTAQVAGGSSNAYAGFSSRAIVSSSDAQTWAHIVGYESLQNYQGTGVLTESWGFMSAPQHTGTGAITNDRKFYARDENGTTAITNNYGFYVDSLTKGSNNFAFFSAGTTPSSFGGVVSVLQLQANGCSVGTAALCTTGAANVAGFVTTSIGYRFNNAAPAGHILVGNGTNYVDGATSILQASPSNPTGTTSTSLVMMGLGVTTCRFTPTLSTKVQFTIQGVVSNTTSAGQSGILLKFGTGSGPANGAAVTGTSIGAEKSYLASGTNAQIGFTYSGIATGLTVGTTYWFDTALGAISSAGTSTVAFLDCIATEVI